MPTLTQQQIAAGKLAADSLHSKLNQIYQHDNILFGHHDSLAYGRSNGGWHGVSPTNTDTLDFNIDQSDICYALDNNAPALYGWDLIGLEDIANAATINLAASSAKLRNNIPVKDVIAWIKKVHHSGGINTICWHIKNPSNLKDYYDTSNPLSIKQVVTTNSNANKTFIKWLDKLVNFFSCLKDENGLPIPVIFRPFHEVTNFDAGPNNFKPFFWWNQITNASSGSNPSHYKKLWEITISYLYSKGIKHTVNAFCMNDFFIDGNTGSTFSNVRALIPNTNYFDIIGFDAYQRLNTQAQKNNHPHCQTTQLNDSNFDTQKFISRVQQQLDEINNLAIEFNKIPALTEIGADYFYDNSNWWTSTLQQIIDNKNLAYLLTWRNPYQPNDNSSYYAPYYNPNGSDKSDADVSFVNDFIDFYTTNTINSQRVLFLNEVSEMFV